MNINNQLIDLLPLERQQALSRKYFMRVCVVATVFVTILTVVAGALLVPNYIFLTQSISAKQGQLANVDSILSSTNESALSEHLETLFGESAQIIALGNAPSASATIRTVLAIPRPGVSLSGFEYSRADGKIPGALIVSGIAATRDALRSYQVELSGAPFAAAANLPVSAYAKDTNIAFNITVTLAP